MENLSSDDVEKFMSGVVKFQKAAERIENLAEPSIKNNDGNSVSSAQAFATAAPQSAPWHVWACVTLAFISTLLATVAFQSSWNASQRMIELRVDMQAERTSREMMSNWTAQEVAALRSYITTGKLAPMKARPISEEDVKNVP